MTNERVLVGLVCAMLSAAASASAQNHPESVTPAAFEITPYLFLGSGTSSGIGAAVRWPLAPRLGLELDTNYRSAEIGSLSSNLSLLFDFPSAGPVTPYVVGGVGLDQYGTAELVGGRVRPRGRTAVAVNAGGGVRVQADRNWGIRTDARWFNDLGQGPERWRLYNGVTFGRRR